MRTQAVWAGRIFQGIWPPIIFGVGFLLLWEWFVEVRDIEPFVLPKPSAIFEQLRLHHDTILDGRSHHRRERAGRARGRARRGGDRRAAGRARARARRDAHAAGRRHGGDPDRGAGADLQHDVRLDLEHAAAARGGDLRLLPDLRQHAARPAADRPGARGAHAQLRGVAVDDDEGRAAAGGAAVLLHRPEDRVLGGGHRRRSSRSTSAGCRRGWARPSPRPRRRRPIRGPGRS